MIRHYLEAVILYSIKMFKGERSVHGIYHMLKGKKSSQTIQDAHFFRLSPLFGTVPSLSREELMQTAAGLENNGLIDPGTREDHFIISWQGDELLTEYLDKQPVPASLNGLKFHSDAFAFWARLSLLIQSLSHIIRSQKSFYPIQRNLGIQSFVKQFLSGAGKNRVLLAEHLFSELVSLLETREALEQKIFVLKLSGSHRIGNTYNQIAAELADDEWHIKFVFLGTIHFMMEQISMDKGDYPLLASLLKNKGNSNNGSLTQSSKATLEFLEKGYSLQDIAGIRKLKSNTIEDHIVEIALADKEFPIHDYVSEKEKMLILRAAGESKTKQLKSIKMLVKDESISFFKIRLVLAKAGDNL
ncbi:helix-turn-helix domain-containing protein [Actinomycetes bacterium NPDC127524]